MSFIITDHLAADDPIIFCNTAFERLTGYSRAEILGKNCRFLQGEAQDQPALNGLREAMRKGEDCTLVLLNFRKDGSPFRNELVISPVFGDNGAATHFIGIQRDLESVAGTRHSVDNFHHEWRTPLTIIKSTLQVLERKGLTVDPEFLNKSLKAAIQAIGRLEKLGQGQAEVKS